MRLTLPSPRSWELLCKLVVVPAVVSVVFCAVFARTEWWPALVVAVVAVIVTLVLFVVVTVTLLLAKRQARLLHRVLYAPDAGGAHQSKVNRGNDPRKGTEMSMGEFERAGFGESGRRMDVATHNARVAEKAGHSSAQEWRDSRWSVLDCHLDDLRRRGK